MPSSLWVAHNLKFIELSCLQSWATLQAFRTAPHMKSEEVFFFVELMPDPTEPNVKRKPRIVIKSFRFVKKVDYPDGNRFPCFRGVSDPREHVSPWATRPRPQLCYGIRYESLMIFGRPLHEDMTSSPDIFMMDHMLDHQDCHQWPWAVADMTTKGLQASDATSTYLMMQAVIVSALRSRPDNPLETWQAPAMSLEPWEPSRLEEWRELLSSHDLAAERKRGRVSTNELKCDCDERLDIWRAGLR